MAENTNAQQDGTGGTSDLNLPQEADVQQDNTVISKRSWLWIVTLLVAANVYQYQAGRKLDSEHAAELRQLNDKREEKSEKLTEYAIQVAELSNELRNASEKYIHGKDTATIHRSDFDSPFRAK